MHSRYFDLTDHALNVAQQYASSVIEDFKAERIRDLIGGSQVFLGAAGASECFSREVQAANLWNDDVLGAMACRGADMASSTRAFEALHSVGLAGLTDRDLRLVYGDLGELSRTRETMLGSLDALMISSASRFSHAASRQSWIESCLPAFDSVSVLGRAVWLQDPFSSYTQQLLEQTVGEQSFEAVEALDRTHGLRRRRELYRELRADSTVEELPPTVVQTLFRPEPDSQSGAETSFLALIVRESPLTRYNGRCYRLVGAFEAFLRRKLDAMLQVRFGPEWVDSISSDYRSRWRRNHRKQLGGEPTGIHRTAALLHFSELSDVMELVLNYFEGSPSDKDELEFRFVIIRGIRNHTAHQRPMLAEDFISLQAAVIEVGRVLSPRYH